MRCKHRPPNKMFAANLDHGGRLETMGMKMGLYQTLAVALLSVHIVPLSIPSGIETSVGHLCEMARDKLSAWH